MVFFRNDDENGSELPVEKGGERIVPLLPLRDIVVFPNHVVPLFVGRAKSIQALEDAVAGNRELMLSAQRQAGQDEPGQNDIYTLGTLGTIIQLLRLPDGTVKVLVEGKCRARIQAFRSADPYFRCAIEELPDNADDGVEVEALVRSIHAGFESYVKLNKKVPPELLNTITSIHEAGQARRHHRLAPEPEARGAPGHPRDPPHPRPAATRSTAACRPRSRCSRWSARSAAASRSRWSAPRRSTTSTSRCGRSRRSWATATSSRTRSRSSRSSCRPRRCPTRRGSGARRSSASSR